MAEVAYGDGQALVRVPTPTRFRITLGGRFSRWQAAPGILLSRSTGEKAGESRCHAHTIRHDLPRTKARNKRSIWPTFRPSGGKRIERPGLDPVELDQLPARREYDLSMLLLGIILFGMLVGAAAQLIVGRSAKGVDWGLALAAGIVGSFIGGLLISLLLGDGLAFRPSGIIGSLAGAVIVTLVWHWWRTRRAASRR